MKVSSEKQGRDFFDDFLKIGKDEQELISSWFINEILMIGNLKSFDRLLENVLKVEHDFWVVEDIVDFEKLNYVIRKSGLNLRKAYKDELVLWAAYNAAKGKWRYADISERVLEKLAEKIWIVSLN